MNARSYKTGLNISPLDFPAIDGLGETSVLYRTEVPQIINNKMVLSITKYFILTDINTNKEYKVWSAQSVYEIPTNEIKSREDVHEFYKDATLSLNEVYQFAQTQESLLPSRLFPNQPIENYQPEIDRVFDLLNSRN